MEDSQRRQLFLMHYMFNLIGLNVFYTQLKSWELNILYGYTHLHMTSRKNSLVYQNTFIIMWGLNVKIYFLLPLNLSIELVQEVKKVTIKKFIKQFRIVTFYFLMQFRSSSYQ